MSQYYGKTLSNTVKVKDVNEFQEIISGIEASEPIMFEVDEQNSAVTFYSYGIIELNAQTFNNGKTVQDIQRLLPDNEFLVVKEIGNEKFVHFNADAYIISNNTFDYINFDDILQDKIENSRQVISFKQD